MDFVDGVVVDGNTTIANAQAANSLKFKNNIIAGTVAAKVATTTNVAFNVATWFTDNMNTSQASSTGLLTAPYNTTDGSTYTGLDYRPATGSAALTGADFTEITASLGTETINLADSASLKSYPNPFTSSFRLSFESTSTDEVSLNAYDLTGRIIEANKLNYNEVNNQEFGVNYQSGMYILVLKQGEITKSFRVIKK
jgi:hypothetical protein